jgi:hypothetical protein
MRPTLETAAELVEVRRGHRPDDKRDTFLVLQACADMMEVLADQLRVADEEIAYLRRIAQAYKDTAEGRAVQP